MTRLQQKALHLYFTKLSRTLNRAGLDMRKTLKQEIDIPWSEYLIKEHLWRDLQLAMTNKKSTRDLTTKECMQVHEVLSAHLSMKLGVYVPWPCEEELRLQDQLKKAGRYE